MKLFFYILREFFITCYEAIVKRLPYRNKLCWLFGHLYKGVYIKKQYSGLKYPEGVIVGDTEGGCVYCDYKTKNRWPEYQLDRNRPL